MAILEATAEAAAATVRTAQRAPNFRHLIGEAAWGRLPAAVQHRFGAHAGEVAYPGAMDVRASLVGQLFAQVCRIIGNPLAPWTGEAVPVTVNVWTDRRGALVWDRFYEFAGRPRLLVSSRKMIARDGAMLEVTASGLGMRLEVTERGGALYFTSRGYFLLIGEIRIGIPGVLTPGPVVVSHTDLGGGAFRFEMTFTHPWFGETLHQAGVFADPPRKDAQT